MNPPASLIVTMMTIGLLIDPRAPPYFWPLLIPGLVPPLIVGFCFWSLLPSWRARVPARYAAGIAWDATLLLCLSILPMSWLREMSYRQEEAARAQYAADFAKLPPDAPLREWTPFLATQDDMRLSTALDGIRHLDRRQDDAEIMLDRGDFPLRFLGSLDLDPTPSLCDKARALLRRQVAPLVIKDAGTRPYADIATQVSDALAAMTWLVGYNCPVDAESAAWESMAKAYDAWL